MRNKLLRSILSLLIYSIVFISIYKWHGIDWVIIGGFIIVGAELTELKQNKDE